MEWINDSVADSGAVVVSPLYCAPHVVHLTFTKKAIGIKSRHLAVVDANDRVMYKVEGHHSWTIRDRMLLLDASDQPILLVQSQRKSSHAAYDVYRGDSRDARDLLFSIRKASKVEVHVCLASHHKKHSVDFTIRGNVKKGTIGVYKTESTQMIAEMEQITSSVHANKEAFGVAVSPNVDSCFIAAIFTVLPRIYHSSAKSAYKASKKSGPKRTSKKSGSKEASEEQEPEEEDSEESESEEEEESAESEPSTEGQAEGGEEGSGLLELLQSVFETFSSE